MTDAPPPSIPPSIPPRKRPSSTPAGTWGVTTVPGRDGPETDGTERAPAAGEQPRFVVPESARATRRTPTAEPRDVRPAPGAPFPVAGPPGLRRRLAGFVHAGVRHRDRSQSRAGR